MANYLTKRILTMIFTFFGITLITFFIIRIAPGDPISLKMSAGEIRTGSISKGANEELMKIYGLKVDLPEGYENFIANTAKWIHGEDPQEHPVITRKILESIGQNAILYKTWLQKILRLDFGISTKDQRPVLDKIKEALPITLMLNLLEILIVYWISIPLGVFSAIRKNTFADKSLMVFLFMLYSLPEFWVATLLLLFFAGGDYLNWFPLGGITSEGSDTLGLGARFLDLLWHLVLPVFTMVYGSFAFLTRFSRNTMLEVLSQDYIRTARAKGLKERTVIWKHGFRNSLVSLITLMSTLLPALLGGSVIVEQIFSIPGMGRLAFEAVLSRDYNTIMAITTITAFLTLISLLLSDLAYTWVDPRIHFQSKGAKA